MMTEKEMFLATRQKEHATTVKVLKAFPGDKLDFKPHERSRDATSLAWGFAGEELLNRMIVEGKVDFTKLPRKNSGDLAEILAAYEKNFNDTTGLIEGLTDVQMDEKIDFGGEAQVRRGAAFWDILYDAIHHRGQFSVYIRMAGGKVPSIYGPSADEPWDAK